jgi:hypothetical protein
MFAIELIVALLSVKFPTVVEELPIVKARVRADKTSIAPMERAAVPMLIPAVVAVPLLLN